MKIKVIYQHIHVDTDLKKKCHKFNKTCLCTYLLYFRRLVPIIDFSFTCE